MGLSLPWRSLEAGEAEELDLRRESFAEGERLGAQGICSRLLTLDEAIDASTVNAAAFTAMQDIVRCGDGTTWWWLGKRYVKRDKPVSQRVLESDGWYPIQPIRPVRKVTDAPRD